MADASSGVKGQRDECSNNGAAGAVPGSPSIVFLSRPIVVEKRAGEKTGLLPTLNRPESRASKQIRRCQLVVVVVMSVITAAVIILYWVDDSQRDDGRR
eukprot:g2000.t1